MNALPTKSINQTQAVSEFIYEMKDVPLLDMQDPQFAYDLIDSFKNIGFVIVKNHGIPTHVIDETFTNARQAFRLKPQIKKSIVFQQDMNRGYSGVGQQVLDLKHMQNQKKQTFDLGHPEGPDQIRFYPKHEGIIQSGKKIYEFLFRIYTKIMMEMQKGLKLEEGTITKKCCKDIYNQTLRLLYYPQVTFQEIQKTGKVRAGAHSDYGTITLLFQKPGTGQNGLLALNSSKQWVKVNPPDYCMVINLGDLFQHWSNNVLRSTIHKVEVDEQVYHKLSKGQLQKAPQRQTIVFFCNPDQNQIFQCLPGLGQPKYKPINGKQYVIERVKSTHGHKSY